MGLFQKVMTHKLCQNANFENGGTSIQVSILYVLLSICQYLHFLGYMTCLSIRDAKRVVMSFYALKKINKMQVAG